MPEQHFVYQIVELLQVSAEHVHEVISLSRQSGQTFVATATERY